MGELIFNEDVTLFYSEQQMQGGNWIRYDVGYKSIDGKTAKMSVKLYD